MKRNHVALGAGIAIGGWALSRAIRAQISFAGKVILISGGSRGLGLVIARQLADEGARLALLARDAAELARAKSELICRGAEVLTITTDVADRAQIVSALEEIVRRFHRVDVLINNAGIIEVGPFAHMSAQDFERSLAIHALAPVELTMLVRPHMLKAGGGRIVNICSIGGKIAVPHLAPYCAGKFALTGFSDAIRAELAAENISVTTVVPGMMRTGSHVNARFKGKHSAEFAWFGFLNGLPLISISAERAARKIIAACKRGQPSLTLTFAARFAIAGNAIAPNLTGYAMQLFNLYLPRQIGPAGNELQTGWESRTASAAKFTRHLDAATARNNEER